MNVGGIYTKIEIESLYMTPNEIRQSHGLKPISHTAPALTNCVNCGAVIDPALDCCPYCETSYMLMGIKPLPKETGRLEVEVLKSEIKALQDAVRIRQLYESAIIAMRHYGD